VAVKHAVLGLLIERQSYGHELANRLDERLGPGFGVSAGAIYGSLKTLKDDGHIEVVKRVRRGEQMRVYYGSTHEGVQHFESWMEEPLGREPLRGELYMKFALTSVRRVPMLRDAFQRLELECLAEIAAHASAQQLVDELADPIPLAAATRLLLDSGVLDRLNADLAFIRRTLEVLRWAESQGNVPRSTLLEAVTTA
jgi:DNA-binding PadR family transcriptional regulator